jgi:hypothetical protein
VTDTSFDDRARPGELVAGFLAAISMVASVLALAYKPVVLAPFAILVALLAAALAGRDSKLPGFAVGIATLAWLLGMTIAVVTGRPLY